jgi:hypothetical protein
MPQKNQNGSKVELTNIICAIILVAVIGTGGHFLGKHNQKNIPVKTDIAGVQAISYDGRDGVTALDLLKEKANIEVQDSSIGTFVLGINEVKDTEDHYWMFYLNGELAPYSPDQYVTKSTDKIEWRFDKVE